ncbi:Uncharacterised protein [Candidatus Gugararchaeum adminiculabundum]|nr:Uncharacterised protein [Candidatus Gugararchaeum adminiculabundum]
MTFDFTLSDELKEKIGKLLVRDRKRAEILGKKIREIVSSDEETIERYKNLRHDMKGHKRVHLDAHFVLVFRVFKKERFILFEDFDHHDNIYG